MAAKKEFSFKAPLERLEDHLITSAIFIPEKIMDDLPKSRCRVKGKLNSTPFSLAIQYRKAGRSFITVSQKLCKEAGLKIGDRVQVSFRLVDASKVDVPEELAAVLEQDSIGKAAWDKITTGLQRSLIVHINSVKNVDSRISRALFIVNKAKTGAYESKATKKKTDE